MKERDEYYKDELFRIKRYVARNSVFSIIANRASSPYEEYFNSQNKWADRMAELDYEKNCLNYISEDSEGWLLVDFIDERLGLVELEGTLFTYSMVVKENLKDSHATLRKVNPLRFTDDKVQHSVKKFCEELIYIYPPTALLYIVLLWHMHMKMLTEIYPCLIYLKYADRWKLTYYWKKCIHFFNKAYQVVMS